MNDVSTALLGWLAATSCQLLVPFTAALLLDRLLPARGWPELRAAAWALVALKLLLPPTIGTSWHAPLAAITAPPPALLETANAWQGWIVGLWAFGAVAWLAITTRAQNRLLRLAHVGAVPMPGDLLTELQALAAQAGLRKLPRVLLTNATLGTFVHANPRQQLVIDRAQLATLDHEARRHLLLHELTHLRRRDPQWALAGTMLQAIWWFHPLAWLVLRRLHALRELCCDQSVVRVLGGDPRDYRRSLLQAARSLLRNEPARQHAFAPWGSLALQRLRALECPDELGQGCGWPYRQP